jgi:acetoin utilization deacetylase AcuC-like enzyme
MNTLLLTHPACLRHDTGAAHPESAERLKVILRALEAEEFCYLIRDTAPKATREQLLTAHSPAYLDKILSLHPAPGGHLHLDHDTVISADSAEAALYAAGAVIAAVDEVAQRRCHNAFCAVRPPGHHAEPELTSGFCLFSNVAIGALHARTVHGFQRVAVVDFDVHHGNGTQAVLSSHPAMFYASSHQQDLFPNSAAAERAGPYVVNVALPAGSGSDEFRQAYTQTILPRLRAYAPDFLLISAGFDGHATDPLSDLRLQAGDFAWVTRELLASCLRVVSVLEGGYELAGLSASVAAHVRALMAGPYPS